MTGAIPVFLTPTRNHFGIIGPIPQSEFRWENIERKIRAHPFAKDVKAKPRILTITQSTYDGILYNVDTIKDMLGSNIDTLHFDEAWLPHATFHDFYRGMHAIGKDRPRSKDSMVFSTQSTHKLLAGLSQASQILVQDSETRQLDRHRFNEAYLMHSSTSPQYAIIASCDVAAAMMESPGGPALVEESIMEALDFRRAMRKVDEEFGDSWWFKVWGPDRLAEEGIGSREDWMLAPTSAGTASASSPRASTCSTRSRPPCSPRGSTSTGEFAEPGIPASIVTKYLAEHGVIVEKTGLYSFFIMFTIGITKGRWNTMVTALQQFKADYDANNPLWKVLPEFVQAHPRYEKIGLRDLCDSIHGIYKANDVGAADHRDVRLEPGARDAAGRRVRAHGAPRDRARGDRRPRGTRHQRAAHALSARHPAAHPRRAVQQPDRQVPAVRARLQRAFPGLRHRHPRAGRGGDRRAQPLLRRLRGGREGDRRGALAAARAGGAHGGPDEVTRAAQARRQSRRAASSRAACAMLTNCDTTTAV